MKLVTLDFETFYSKEYSLSRMTTQEYIDHESFEVIGVAAKVGAGETEWCSGNWDTINIFLRSLDQIGRAHV